MSRLIDYDAQFREYFDNWYELNRERYTKPEQIEEKLHSLYDEWAAKERAELDKMDIKQLNELFMQYAECGEVPDLVCEAIVRKGREGEKGLYELYRAGMLSTPAVITIINLLAEMKSSLPYADYTPPLLSSLRPVYRKDKNEVRVEIRNFGLSASGETTIEVKQNGMLMGSRKIKALKPYEKTELAFTPKKGEWTDKAGYQVVFLRDGQVVETNNFTIQ